MSKLLIYSQRGSDESALSELLLGAGYEVEPIRDLGAAEAAHAPDDVIVADVEPWTWQWKRLVEGAARAQGRPKVVLLSTRVPMDGQRRGVLYVRKPVVLEALRAALSRICGDAGENEAA